MVHFKRFMGLGLVFLGALVLILAYVAGLTSHNSLLITAWAMIAVGIIAHVVSQKRGSRY